MQYLANINVVIQDFVCIDDRCYVLVKNKSDAVLIVNNGIGTEYEENTITEEPENPVLLANENISTIVGYQWAYNQSTINWQGGYDIAAPRTNLRTRVAVIDRGYITHKDGGLVDCSRVEMRKGNIASGNFFGMGHWSIKDWVAREPHYMAEACDTDIGTDGGHGTSVIGVVTSNQDNLSAYKSASYGRASVDSIRVPYDSYNAFAVLRAVQAVSDSSTPSNKILAVNMSIGTDSSSYKEELRKLGEDKNIIVVAAAGNDRQDLGRKSSYPATFGLPNMITVAALTEYNGIADFSNYSGYTDIAAPGASIRTLHKDTISYRTVDGTSFSAPFITGVLAAGQAVGFNLEPQQLIHLLYNTANRYSNLETQVRNGKVVNVGAFLAAAKACNDDSACRLRVPNTWPERKNMKNMGTPPVPPIPDLNDIDAYPPNWFPPKNISTVTSGGSIILSWTHPKFLADYYSVACWQQGETPNFVFVSSDNRSHSINNLLPGFYSCQVKSIKRGAEASENPKWVELSIPKPSLSASRSSSNIKLAWSYTQYPIDYFILEWRNPYGGVTTITIPSYLREYNLSGVLKGIHIFSMRAVRNGVGNSDPAYVNINVASNFPEPWYEMLTEDNLYFIVPENCVRIDYDLMTGWRDLTVYLDNVIILDLPQYSFEQGSISARPGQRLEFYSSMPPSYWGDYGYGSIQFVGLHAPGNINIERTSERNVKLTWQPPATSLDNYSIIWIRGNDWGEILTPSSYTSYEIMDLPDGIYQFAIASVKNGAYSDYTTKEQWVPVPLPLPVSDIKYEFFSDSINEEIILPPGYFNVNYSISLTDIPLDLFRENKRMELEFNTSKGAYYGSFPAIPGYKISLNYEGIYYGYFDARAYVEIILTQ